MTNQNAVQKENGISNGWLENAINSIFGDWNQQLLTQPMTAQKEKKKPKTFTYKHMYKSHFAATLAIFKKSWVFFCGGNCRLQTTVCNFLAILLRRWARCQQEV